VEPIPVPAPPKTAFNKNRPVSDLLVAQLKHFQHIEQKRGIQLDPALKRDIDTEGGAARYIASMTRAIRSQSQARPESIALVPSAGSPPSSVPTMPQRDSGLAIAAAGDSSPTPPLRRSAGASTKSRKRKKP
jgi:hypothetical protein